ncbi:MAG: hypothetical protein HOW73_07425 [Polyangiaceae bacterium]|nr:hypothetical protein [Polyangiaceae bacterium]
MSSRLWKTLVVAATAAIAVQSYFVAKLSRVHTAVTVLTPYVAPSDELCVEYTVRKGQRETEDVTICERVPADSPVGTPIAMQAELDGPDLNRPRNPLDPTANSVVAFEVPVRSLAGRTLSRACALLSGVAAILLFVLLVARKLQPMVRNRGVGGQGIVEKGVWALAVPIGSFLLAKAAVHPIAAALGVGGSVELTICSVALTIAVIAGGRWLAGPARPTTLVGRLTPRDDKTVDYRAAMRPAAASWSEVAGAIRRNGLQVAEDGSTLRVSYRLWARNREADVQLSNTDADHIGLRFNDSALLGRTLDAMVPVVGPSRLEITIDRERFEYVIDGPAEARRFVDEFRAAQLADRTPVEASGT